MTYQNHKVFIEQHEPEETVVQLKGGQQHEKDDRNLDLGGSFIYRSKLFRAELGGTSHDAHGGTGDG